MSTELKRNKCLETIHSTIYHADANLLTSGRYIKTLRHLQSKLDNDADKMKYEFLINRCLQKHIIYLQESIINSLNKKPTEKIIPTKTALSILSLAKSDYKTSDDKYSLVDVDDLKRMQTIKKAVLLNKDLVLPCKVKSENNNYKFNTEIIVTKSNVLAYASYDYEHDPNLINHCVLLNKVGNGLKNSALINKSSNTQQR